MSLIGPTTAISARPHYVQLQRPSDPVSDGEGGYSVEPWTDLSPPRLFAHIAPTVAADLERFAHGVVTAHATHTITLPYHPQLTTLDRIVHNGRTFHVLGVASPEERGVETVALCHEVVT
jgi:head-tail adaptor